MSADDLKKTYRELGIARDAADGVHEKVLEKLSLLFPSLAGIKIADAPCGHGAIAQTCARHGAEVTAFDLYPPAHASGKGVRFEQVDLNQSLMLSPNSQDVVLSVEGIEHLENPTGWLRQIGRCLKPGGYAIISTPNVDSLSSRFKFFSRGHHRFFEPMGYRAGRPRASGHIHAIDFIFMTWAAEAAGLEMIEAGSHKGDAPQRWIDRWFARLFYKRFPAGITRLMRGSVAVYVLRKDATIESISSQEAEGLLAPAIGN